MGHLKPGRPCKELPITLSSARIMDVIRPMQRTARKNSGRMQGVNQEPVVACRRGVEVRRVSG
jgi:hypothetical protein